jgi:hypothetical protein
MDPVLKEYACIIPRARAYPPQAWCSHPPPSLVAAAAQRAGVVLAAELGKRAALLHTVWIRRTIFFPDRRLVQYDCGKLQVRARVGRRGRPRCGRYGDCAGGVEQRSGYSSE